MEVRTLREALDVLFGSDALPQRQERQQQYARQRRRSKTSAAAAAREQQEVEGRDVGEDGGSVTDADDRGSGLSRLVPSIAMPI